MRAILLALLLAGTAQGEIRIVSIARHTPNCEWIAPKSQPKQPGGAKQAAKPKPATKAPPVLYADDLPADQQPTPMEGVGATLDALNMRTNEILVDYGCGFDARMLITAANRGVKQCIGVEIDPVVAESARQYVKAAGLSDRITIITGDATKVDVKADIGVAYLWPETLKGLRPKITKLKRFASYSHPVPGWEADPIETRAGNVYLYHQPKPQTISLPAPRPVAVWNGRQYSAPVCNSRNCSMCAAIRSQLNR